MTRTFVALTISENVMDYLNRFVDALKKTNLKASWTKLGNFHITLKFLGNISNSQIEKTINCLSELNTNFPIPFETDSVSAFPNINSPKVLWQGLNCIELFDIAKQVEEKMHKIGFDKMNKPFKSHITLGRIKSIPESDFNKHISGLTKIISGEFTDLVLYKSDLTKAGPIYTPIWEYSSKGVK